MNIPPRVTLACGAVAVLSLTACSVEISTRTLEDLRDLPCEEWSTMDRDFAMNSPEGFDWGELDDDGDGVPC